MPTLTPSPLLRFALRLDAVASAAVGAISCLGLQHAQALLGAPSPYVLGAGVFMLVYGVTIGWVSTRNRIDTRLLWVVIIGNLLWAIDTALLAVSGWISPQTLGLVLLLAQALAVAVFAELQYLGLRQSRALAGP